MTFRAQLLALKNLEDFVRPTGLPIYYEVRHIMGYVVSRPHIVRGFTPVPGEYLIDATHRLVPIVETYGVPLGFEAVVRGQSTWVHSRMLDRYLEFTSLGLTLPLIPFGPRIATPTDRADHPFPR